MAYWSGVTAASVRAFLGSTNTADDSQLQALADAAANGIETWISRVLVQHSVTEVTDGNGKSLMLFGEYPVTAVSGVSINGVAIPAATNWTGMGYRFDPDRISLQNQVFTKGVMNVTLTYTAGYATIPPELTQAAIESVALKYTQRKNVGINSKSLATETISFDQSDFPKSALGMMKSYRRVVPLP